VGQRSGDEKNLSEFFEPAVSKKKLYEKPLVISPGQKKRSCSVENLFSRDDLSP
jgi:hypothetical protein